MKNEKLKEKNNIIVIKNKKGITLIALIITVIVMLILARSLSKCVGWG